MKRFAQEEVSERVEKASVSGESGDLWSRAGYMVP